MASAWLAERETGEPVYSLSDTLMGCLSGLVSITAGCAYVQSWASIIIGFVAGILYLAGSRLMIRFGIDDAVDAVCDSHGTHSLYETQIVSNQCFLLLSLLSNRSQSTCSVECGVLLQWDSLRTPDTSLFLTQTQPQRVCFSPMMAIYSHARFSVSCLFLVG